MKKLPKYITAHPGVEFADTGENQGSDYRWYIELRDGWCLAWGRNEGGGSYFFNNREDVKGLIVRVETYREMCRLRRSAPQQRGEA